MRKLRTQHGFTLAEMMVVIAIIIILVALAFSTLRTQTRSMEKLRYDGYAKELFVAAQNHLTMAKTQNYLGRTDFGTPDPDEEGVYYFVVPSVPDPLSNANSVLGLMLPVGSIDESVRQGCYIIRYHKDSGQILDVFYWSDSDGDRFAHDFTESDYAAFKSRKNDADALKTYGSEESVIGYYGGVVAESLTLGEELTAPTIRVINAEKLYVIVTDPNPSSVTSDAGYALKLIVEGEFGGKKTFVLKSSGAVADASRVSITGDTYTILLDDVTSTGLHFSGLIPETGRFTPGEMLALRATAMNNAVLTNVADSPELTANSLFGDASDTVNGEAEIANFRHLANLDNAVSGVNDPIASLRFDSAFQTTDLSWTSFKSNIGNTNLSIYDAGGNASPAGTFRPVSIEPDHGSTFAYNGNSRTIANVTVTAGTGEAGVFGRLKNCTVSDLKLLDVSIAGGNAGALAGTVSGTTVTNVIAVNSAAAATETVTGSGSVGGLIGNATGTTLEQCAAALVVRSTGGSAGGLVGILSGNSLVTECYSGGHTANAAYSVSSFNVSATASAGGLVGTAGESTRIRNSYSTCSASGGTATGGFAGTSSGPITNCYATGRIGGTESLGAFAGLFTGTAAKCRYYEIVNEIPRASAGYVYLSAVSTGAYDGISPFDATADAYNAFVGGTAVWADARPYDNRLKLYYSPASSAKYPFPTVERLKGTALTGDPFVKVHYGDWPAPETPVGNTPE